MLLGGNSCVQQVNCGSVWGPKPLLVQTNLAVSSLLPWLEWVKFGAAHDSCRAKVPSDGHLKQKSPLTLMEQENLDFPDRMFV